MLGGEGKLGRWNMPTVEPDMQQKIRDNFTTLADSVAMIRIRREVGEQFPKKVIVFTLKRDGTRLTADKQVKQIWEGAAAGALNELNDEGLYNEAMELLNTRKKQSEEPE